MTTTTSTVKLKYKFFSEGHWRLTAVPVPARKYQ